MRIMLIAALALLVACGGTDNPAGAGATYGLTLTEPESGARIGDTLRMFSLDSRDVRATATAVGAYVPASARILFEVPAGAARLASSGDGDAPGNAVAHVAGVREGVTLLRASLVDRGRVLAAASVPVRVIPVMRTVVRDAESGDSISHVLWTDGERSGVTEFRMPVRGVRTYRFAVVNAQTGEPITGRYSLVYMLDSFGAITLADTTATADGIAVTLSSERNSGYQPSRASVAVRFESDRIPNSPLGTGFHVVTPSLPAQSAAVPGPPARMMPGDVWSVPTNGEPEHNSFTLHYLNRDGAGVAAMLTIRPDRVRGGALAVGDTMTLSPYTVRLTALDTATGAASFHLENTGHPRPDAGAALTY